METSFYSDEELKELGFKEIGKNVSVSRFARFYGIEHIILGDNVRIDDFVILSTNENQIKIGSYVHIACYACIFGQGGVEIGDFSTLSSRVSLYSLTDDYLGGGLTNPTVPIEYRNVCYKKVVIKKHCIVGTGSTILPGVTIEEGASIGAMTLVNNNLEAFGVYIGIPGKLIKKRSQELLKFEKKFIKY